MSSTAFGMPKYRIIKYFKIVLYFICKECIAVKRIGFVSIRSLKTSREHVFNLFYGEEVKPFGIKAKRVELHNSCSLFSSLVFSCLLPDFIIIIKQQTVSF